MIHALRDRPTVEEAAHLGSQFPTLVRGSNEGWKPSKAPNEGQTRAEFISAVDESLRTNDTIDRSEAAKSVFRFLRPKISEGQVEDMRAVLPKEIEQLRDG